MPAAPAPREPLEQGGTLAWGTAAVLSSHGSILIQLPLVLQVPLPGEISGMVPGDEEWPVFGPDPPCPPFDPGLLTGQALAAGLGAAIDVGARVGGIVQDGQDPIMAEGFPDQVALSSTTPKPGGTTEVVLGEVRDDGQGRGRLLEEVEDQAQGVPDLFVGVEDDPALRIVDQPRGRSEPELALGGLLE